MISLNIFIKIKYFGLDKQNIWQFEPKYFLYFRNYVQNNHRRTFGTGSLLKNRSLQKSKKIVRICKFLYEAFLPVSSSGSGAARECVRRAG